MIKNNKAHKAQGQVSSYASYVIQELIGIKGTNPSDVVSFIINDWIAKSQPELDRINVTVANWRKKEGRKKR